MIVNSNVATAVAEGLQPAVVPASMNGMNLVGFTCAVAGLNSATGGNTTVAMRRRRAGSDVEMLTTSLNIAYNAYTSSTVTINTSNYNVQTGDEIFVDIDAITTGAAQLGLSCTAVFQTP